MMAKSFARRVVPNDHECLFSAVALLAEGVLKRDAAQRLREFGGSDLGPIRFHTFEERNLKHTMFGPIATNEIVEEVLLALTCVVLSRWDCRCCVHAHIRYVLARHHTALHAESEREMHMHACTHAH